MRSLRRPAVLGMRRAGKHVVGERLAADPQHLDSSLLFGTVVGPLGGGDLGPPDVTPGRLRSDHDDRLSHRHALRRLAQRSQEGRDMNVRDIEIVGYAVVLPVALLLQGRRFASTVPPETAQ